MNIWNVCTCIVASVSESVHILYENCSIFPLKLLSLVIFSLFSVQDPEPRTVMPERGPAAGGTVITIGGKDLDTATKEDVAVTVGGVPCEV